MKKHLLILFAALLSLAASAQTKVEIDDIWYNLVSKAKQAEVTFKGSSYDEYDEYSGPITIPATVTYEGVDYSVTSIGEWAFSNCHILTDITIPESVTSIGEWAFSNCSSLTDITLTEGVTSIGEYAFSNCSSLTTITLTEGVTSIGEYAFLGCHSLTAINIPEGVTSIESCAFAYCSSLTAITVAEGNAVYDSRGGCNAIIETNSNTLIAGCSTTIIPESVTSIGNYAFYWCSSLTTITLPASVTSIGDGAFYWCSSLTTITLPESVTSIGNYAFYDCSNLTDINIPENSQLTSIGERAFYGCSSLTDINIPEGVTSIESYAFAYCSSLTAITVAEGNAVYDSRGGCNSIIETNSNTLIAGCSTTIIPESVTSIGDEAFHGCSSLTDINIPESVTSIGEWAFYDCYRLTAINIPENSQLTSIGNYAFYDCSSLTAINIPENSQLTSIGEWAFSNCSSLTAINIPEGVTSIRESAFAYCSSLTSITIPEGVTSIGWSAFSGCSSLTTITCHAATPPTIAGSYTFYDVDKSIPVYVPAGSVEAYKAAEGWGKFTNILPLAQENDFTLTVSSAGYATLFLDYAAKIPDNVKAYIATSVEGDRLMMTRVTGVLPAETGVIVRANAGTYTFVESEDTPTEVEGNLLSGSSANKTITAESGYRYYVLAKKNDVVAMYHPQLTDGKFTNMANKAYLALKADDLGIFDEETNTEDEGGQLSNRLRFDFGGTTDVEMTTDSRRQTTDIYDLHGRRIENPTKGGIYIVNGKKVVVK